MRGEAPVTFARTAGVLRSITRDEADQVRADTLSIGCYHMWRSRSNLTGLDASAGAPNLEAPHEPVLELRTSVRDRYHRARRHHLAVTTSAV